MILRKPYAFFIKIFKPMHFALAILIAYLIYLDNKIMSFLSIYINSDTNVVGQSIRNNLVSPLIYIIPIIIIILSLIILGIMFRKKKPITFYVINIFAFIVILIVNLYVSNFLGILEKYIVAVRTVKLIHDLTFINISIESVAFVFFVVRGMGVNFKKFDFSSELSKMNISESDKEEFELDINVDLAEAKRKRRRKLRYLKYTYIEHKFLINCILIVTVCIIALTVYSTINIYTKNNKEGVIYSAGLFNFGVDKTLILNTDYKGNVITENDLIVVDTKLQSNMNDINLFLKDFTLKAGDVSFYPTEKYSSLLFDLGVQYNENTLTNEYKNYIFVYEIPKSYLNDNLLFSYSNQGKNINISLNPVEYKNKEVSISKKLGEEISFEDTLGDIKFKIENFELNNKFLIDYRYCIKENDCVSSKEYIIPSINQNFDKQVLKLTIDYNNGNNSNFNEFYDLFSKYGTISYKIGDNWYSQNKNFENIKSSKTNDNSTTYIGVNSEIRNAENIKLVFNVRNAEYEYTLK